MNPKAFVSHSSADKEIIRHLATDLRGSGVDAWFDEWEIRPGDSIVDKINAGIQDCNIFIIAISKNSVASKWVREELNAAVVRRIQENARIIPVRLDQSEVPALLNSLHYVDLSDFAAGLSKLVDAIFFKDARPPLGQVPTSKIHGPPDLGLSDAALKAAAVLFSFDTNGLQGTLVDANQLLAALQMDEREAEDALMELSDKGLSEVKRYMGGALVGPTPRTPFVLELDYDPQEDVHAVARYIASQDGSVSGPQLQEATSLSIPRLNRAIRILGEENLLSVLKALGTAPFAFARVTADHRTRKFVRDNA